MRILVCGHRAFAAQGLIAGLEAGGHEVSTFNRGACAAAGFQVSGPVFELDANPHLLESFDTVINYILLKDDSIERNNQYIDALLRFCKARHVRHLIHISSISSYSASATLITEDAELEQVPERKGSYGSLKAATDLHLLKSAPAELTLTLVRPGFVLGQGLVNPIVGSAARLPNNELLVIGSGKRIFPLITRDLLNEAIIRIVQCPPEQNREALVLVSPDSPTMREYLAACCSELGCGLRVREFPSIAWRAAAVGAEAVARLIGQRKLEPYQKLRSRLIKLRFDCTRTQHRLGMDLKMAWRQDIRHSMDDQEMQFSLPYKPAPLGETCAQGIAFLGFGRIVKQKHLPGLRKLNFRGSVRAYDLLAAVDPGGQEVHAISGASLGKADLFVVASPGPAHIQAIDSLAGADGPVLVEKPLCYNARELDQWRRFAASRPNPVIVCHNYRYKDNVVRMLELLQQHNPGRLKHVSVYFQSPPVNNDSAAWLRNERQARTLLMDYSLHFLDLACMFSHETWHVDGLRHELNTASQTSLIEGRLSCPAYSVGLLLRQGFAPRRARLLFSFQNYVCSLGFFPDTFAMYMADDSPGLYKREARESARATRRKIADKLLGRDSDLSHARVIAAAAQDDPASAAGITVDRLTAFYQLLFEMSRQVYGE